MGPIIAQLRTVTLLGFIEVLQSYRIMQIVGNRRGGGGISIRDFSFEISKSAFHETFWHHLKPRD